MIMVVRQIALTKGGKCFLCQSSISSGRAWRISWEPRPKILKFGHFHLEFCGPAMIDALREREQAPAKTKKRLGGQNR